MNLQKASWRNLARDRRGSEIAETAMILPLFFMIFLAIFWFGQAYRIYGALTHATRAGAEAAIVPICTTCAASPTTPTPSQNAQTAVYNALAAAHLDKNNLVPITQWTRPALCPCGNTSSSCTSTTKACDGTIPDMCVQVNVQLSYTTGGGMGSCGTSVSARYKYPYAFPIPFTTLDLNKMQLPGQAQMRVETQ
jgi:Flp pilus assembly protein TadG